MSVLVYYPKSALAVALALLLCLGCGQTGALYLPQSELPQSELPQSELPQSELPPAGLPQADLPQSNSGPAETSASSDADDAGKARSSRP